MNRHIIKSQSRLNFIILGNSIRRLSFPLYNGKVKIYSTYDNFYLRYHNTYMKPVFTQKYSLDKGEIIVSIPELDYMSCVNILGNNSLLSVDWDHDTEDLVKVKVENNNTTL